MKFEDVVGTKVNFYGVDNCTFKLGKHVFEAMEDESDGYRSYLESVEVKDPSGQIFFRCPLAKVLVVEIDEDEFERYELVDVEDGHVWLQFGTDHADGYYPSFRFYYAPKENKQLQRVIK